MIRTIAAAALVLAGPALAQAPAPQSWPVMGNHTLDMPANGAHSRSRPWLKGEVTSNRKPAKAKKPA